MSLYALTEENDIAAAYRKLVQRIQEESSHYDCHINNVTYSVYWQPAQEVWGTYLDNPVDDAPYWFGFGTDDPASKTAVSNLALQFTFVRDGALRTGSAIFARDSEGKIHLAHTGKITGGRGTAGQAAFLDVYNGQFTYIYWRQPKNAKFEYILLGPLDAPDLITRISGFVHSVENFKANAAAAKKKK